MPMILLCARVTVKTQQQQRKLNNKNKIKNVNCLAHFVSGQGGFGVETSFMLMEIIKL